MQLCFQRTERPAAGKVEGVNDLGRRLPEDATMTESEDAAETSDDALTRERLERLEARRAQAGALDMSITRDLLRVSDPAATTQPL